MDTNSRRLCLATLVVTGLALVLPVGAAEHPTIHHAGVIRSIEPEPGGAATRIVIDERSRLGPPAPTTVRVTSGTPIVRLGRAASQFTAEPGAVAALKVGDYVVVRGVDAAGEHRAEVLWSFGTAE